MSSEGAKKLNFIKHTLPNLILNHNEELQDQIIVECDVKCNQHLDGFMSSMYFLNLSLKDVDGK
jgi:hypothetical protein